MKPLFRWRTEEDEFQGEEERPLTAVPPRKARRLLFLFIGLLAAGAAFVYWQQVRQIQLEEQQIQADVLASHRTWQQAVRGGDFDLFVHLLSADDPAWQNGQRRLFVQGLLLDRAPFGLYAQAEPENVAVKLDPNWQEAVVTFEQTYTAVTGSETTGIIRLQHTSHYQLDGSRWIQTPSPRDFWGQSLIYDGQWLRLIYPERDAPWAQRMAAQLDAELSAICQTAAAGCSTAVNVRLHTEPDSVADLHDLLTPVFDGRFYILPTPTLAGLPLDDNSYQALYLGYTRRIINAFQNSLDLPLPLPDQAIQTICFPGGGSTPRLFQYDPAADAWTAELPDRAFRFLSPLPDDGGVILAGLPASSQPAHLKLSLWQAGEETLLFDDTSRQWRFPPLGWSGQVRPPHALLHEFDTASQTRTLYGWLNLDRCATSGCPVTDLSGYTLWSPDGRSTLIAVGSELWLGDEGGRPLRSLGPAFTPFWLDKTTYGYTRFQPHLELVTATLVDGQPQALLDAAALTAVLGDVDTGLPSITYVAAHPTIPGLLLLAGPEIRGAVGKYNIFAYQVAEDGKEPPAGPLSLRLQLDDPPLGYPSLLAPGGAPPFSFSPDGRYLVAAQLTDPPNDFWNIYLHDIPANQTQIVNAGSPRYPANSPFYDWSGDSQWLVLVDDGFFKLIAPAASYERVILHDFDACYFTAWVNP